MRRFGIILAITVAGILTPAAAFACPICGNHGDTTATLIVYGIFMAIPFAIAGGLAWFIRQQLRALPSEDHGLENESDGGLSVPAPRPRSPRPVKPQLIVSQS